MHNQETIEIEMPGMGITIKTIESCTDLPDYMTAKEIREATLEEEHLSALAMLVLHSWPPTKIEVQNELQPFWSFRNEIVFIDEIAIKRGRIIIPASTKREGNKSTTYQP